MNLNTYRYGILDSPKRHIWAVLTTFQAKCKFISSVTLLFERWIKAASSWRLDNIKLS